MMCMSSGVAPSEALQGAPWVQAALQESLGTFWSCIYCGVYGIICIYNTARQLLLLR